MQTELKKIRQAKGLTQANIVKLTKIPLRSYQTYESGECIPNVYTAQLIAEALSIENVNEIFPLSEYQQK